jgi:hypothetical protein
MKLGAGRTRLREPSSVSKKEDEQMTKKAYGIKEIAYMASSMLPLLALSHTSYVLHMPPRILLAIHDRQERATRSLTL